MIVQFEIPGKPISWKRPGGKTRSGKRRNLNADAMENIRWRAVIAFRKAGITKPHEGPVSIRITFFFKSAKQEEGDRYFHRKRHDIDNLEKLILDGMNGVAYVDDGQVWEVRKRKVVSDEESTLVTVEFQ